MENHSIHDLKQRSVASCIIDTLGTAPVWARTEGMTRGAILSGLMGDPESPEPASLQNDAEPPALLRGT